VGGRERPRVVVEPVRHTALYGYLPVSPPPNLGRVGSKADLARDFDHATAWLERLLAGCTEEQAGIRCGSDSRTVTALANHVAEWLNVVAGITPQLANGSALHMSPDIIEELDAAFAKAAAGRTMVETRLRLRNSASNVRRAIQALPEEDLNAAMPSDGNGEVLVGAFLRHWTCDHVREHAAAIHAAWLGHRLRQAEI